MKYLAIVLLFLCSIASAEPYAVIGGGLSITKAADSTKSAVSPYAGFGYRFGAFAIEAAYLGIDSGSHHESVTSSADNSVPANPKITSVTRSWNGHGLGVFGMGFTPIGSASLFGRVGAYRVNSKSKTTTEVSTLAGNASTDETISEHIWAPALGIGVQDKAGENLNVRAMLEHVQGHGEFKHTTVLSVGLLYSF